jgi:hypothetical protein
MGMFDTVVILDGARGFRCPNGHVLRSFQTKALDDPSMSTYLVHEGRLYLAAGERTSDSDEAGGWRLEGMRAVREHHYTLSQVQPPRAVRVYGHCDECDPVLVRTDRPGLFGDIVSEHSLFVDFNLTFRPGEPLQVERTSGTRDELKDELRRRGVYVLDEDEPLALAHREIKRARERAGRGENGW